jgi:uncharacterized protein DUF5648
MMRWTLWCALMGLMACGTDPAGDDAESSGGEACASGTVCDGRCVDLQTDPLNCGSCGRSCVIGRAQAACSAGECTLASCETGFADCDGDLGNGCELEIDCQTGDSCATSCNSQGTLSCVDPCAPVCELPVESCNAIDDDCNGSCDEGPVAACRVAVHRAYGPNGHYYTTDPNDATSQGYTIEAMNFFHLYGAAAADLRPFFRCSKASGNPFYTTDTACEMLGGVLATVGFIAPQPECGAVPLYRTLNAAANAHFYTVSASERDYAVGTLGFQDQGIAGYVWLAP